MFCWRYDMKMLVSLLALLSESSGHRCFPSQRVFYDDRANQMLNKQSLFGDFRHHDAQVITLQTLISLHVYS